MNPNKKIFLQILLIINLCFLFVLAFGSFAGKTHPVTFWPFSLAGLFFPILFTIAIASLLFWCFVKPKYALFCLAIILLSIPNIIVSFPINFKSGLKDSKKTDQLRVVTWNVNLMNYSAKNTETAIKQNEKIFKTLYELNADVICLQEMFTAVIPDKTYNFIDSFRSHMGYTYHYFSRDFPKFDGKFYSGTIILSKYKIVDSNKTSFPVTNTRSIIRAGILFQNDTIDVVSTHMQNLNLGRDLDKSIIDSTIEPGEDADFIMKLKYGYASQLTQVKTIQKVLDESKRPLIFTGDLNNVPTSYTYLNIKRKMKDAWIQQGSGRGATYKFIPNDMRIDYIFYNQFFKSIQTDRIISNASDHYGVVTDLQLIKK